MLIPVRYKKDKWIVDEKSAMLFIEFRRVLQDENLGARAMAYIALSYDPESKFRSSQDEEQIKRDVYETVYETSLIEIPEKNDTVAAAVQRYIGLCAAPDKKTPISDTENIKGGQPLSYVERKRA